MATIGLFKQSWPTNFSMNQKKDNDKEVNGLLRHSRYILKNHLVLVWELMTGNWMKLRMENSRQIYLIYLHPYLYIHTYMYLWKGFSANTEELVGLVVLFIVFGAQAAIFFCWQFFLWLLVWVNMLQVFKLHVEWRELCFQILSKCEYFENSFATVFFLDVE